MKFFLLAPQYIAWHYSSGFLALIKNICAIIEFEFNFFSIKDLLLTLFAPFQRLKEKNRGSVIDIENLLSIFLVNVIMRLVGLVVRTFILICAFICISISFVLSLGIILFWIVLPFLLLFLTIGSTMAYFKYQP